jgi:alpha-beta hydrolase superfamily lysophospholipase
MVGSRSRGRVLVVSVLIGSLIGMIIAVPHVVRYAGGLAEHLSSAPFYEVPDPLQPGDPGELVRSTKLLGAPAGTDAWRVLYHSRDLNDRDVLVSGLVIAPDGETPKGGRPIVSWAHPTTGSASHCAPSRGIDPYLGIEGMQRMLDAGFIVAATDYPGMGVAAPNSYLVGVSEGNSVLDAARVARSIVPSASDELLLWGHSQGGQAALFAAQRAADYAPELELEAVAVAAPATDLSVLLADDIDDVSGVTIGSYAFSAYSTVYGQPLDTILTEAAIEKLPEMNSLCLLTHTSELHSIGQPLVGDFLLSDPSTTEPWASYLAENSPGAARIDVPVLVAQGEADTLVRPQSSADFVATSCSIGTPARYLPVPKATHGTIAFRTAATVVRWFDAALDGTVLPTSC